MEAIMIAGTKNPDHLSKTELDKQLNEALKEAFPASDPVAIGEAHASEPDRPIGRKPALLDKELVRELADHLKQKEQHE
jgi:hypothetical protein